MFLWQIISLFFYWQKFHVALYLKSVFKFINRIYYWDTCKSTCCVAIYFSHFKLSFFMPHLPTFLMPLLISTFYFDAHIEWKISKFCMNGIEIFLNIVKWNKKVEHLNSVINTQCLTPADYICSMWLAVSLETRVLLLF